MQIVQTHRTDDQQESPGATAEIKSKGNHNYCHSIDYRLAAIIRRNGILRKSEDQEVDILPETIENCLQPILINLTGGYLLYT